MKGGAKHTYTGAYAQARCQTEVFSTLSGSGYMSKEALQSWSKDRIQHKHSWLFSIAASPQFWRIQKETGAGTSRHEYRSCQLNMKVGANPHHIKCLVCTKPPPHSIGPILSCCSDTWFLLKLPKNLLGQSICRKGNFPRHMLVTKEKEETEKKMDITSWTLWSFPKIKNRGRSGSLWIPYIHLLQYKEHMQLPPKSQRAWDQLKDSTEDLIFQ